MPQQQPNTFFSWISFLMVWCIESVHERGSLAPQPAQERSGSPQPVVPGQRRKGKEGPRLGAGVTCCGGRKLEVLTISAQHCTEPPTSPSWKAVPCRGCAAWRDCCWLQNSPCLLPATPFQPAVLICFLFSLGRGIHGHLFPQLGDGPGPRELPSLPGFVRPWPLLSTEQLLTRG